MGSGRSQSMQRRARFPFPSAGSASVSGAPQSGQVGRSACPMRELCAHDGTPSIQKWNKASCASRREQLERCQDRATTEAASSKLLTRDVDFEYRRLTLIGDVQRPFLPGLKPVVDVSEYLASKGCGLAPCGLIVRKVLSNRIESRRDVSYVEKILRHHTLPRCVGGSATAFSSPMEAPGRTAIELNVPRRPRFLRPNGCSSIRTPPLTD